MKLFTLSCLKKNNFYENACLGSGMTYGADLVVRVFLQFDYQFTLNQKQILDNASYEILGKLVIVDKDNSTNYYEKDYVFQEKTSSTGGAQGQYYSVNKDIVIDYDEYNKVAIHFKSKYGVDAEGYLIVYLKFYHDLDSVYQILSSGTVSVRIPLSQEAIQVRLDSSEVNQNQERALVKPEFNLYLEGEKERHYYFYLKIILLKMVNLFIII